MSLLRLVPVVARALLAPPVIDGGPSLLRLRVWPSDVDINLHMNNGRYLTMMDLGRFDLLMRARLHRPLLRLRWKPLVGAATIRFRRSLRPFQAYTLHTLLLSWDEKWFVFEQRFESRGELYAVGLVRALFRAPTGNVPPAEVLAAGGIAVPSPAPPVPDYVRAWFQADDDGLKAALGAARAGVDGGGAVT